MMNKKNLVFLGVFLFILYFLGVNRSSYEPHQSVNVYGWYGVIPRDVLKDFEKETGIKVVYDVYDDNNSLEAKLLATNSGYDIVFPSFIPYAAKQVKMGAYQKLSLGHLNNIKNIESAITEKFKKAGGDTDYIVPLFWGTTGIAFEGKTISRILPNEKITSYDILFKPENIRKLAKYGVAFPEEYIDIFPQIKKFLKINGDSDNLEDINKYMSLLKSIRPYIKKFSSTTVVSDLLSGEVCIAVNQSDNTWRSMQSAGHVGKEIKYLLPKGCGLLWIDCVGIPKGAPHPDNAHKFLDYLLKPEIGARISNFSGMLVNIPKAIKFIKKEITDDKDVCPDDKEVLDNLIIGKPSHNIEDIKYDRTATRAWSQIRMNMFENKEDKIKND